MFRMSGALYRDGRILRSCVSRQEGEISRTQKVFSALTEICGYMDLAVPIWLEQNIREFKSRSKTLFRQDSFVESISFDHLEIQVIEE